MSNGPLDDLVKWFFILLALVPFAIWKWVEIIIWIVKHIHINVN